MVHARQLIETASQCCATVRGGSVCTRAAVAWRGKKPYCYTHDPERTHLSVPAAQDRRRRVRWTAEGILAEIALAPAFGGGKESPAGDSDGPFDATQSGEWKQEEMWWRIAEGAGLEDEDYARTARNYGITGAKEAVDAAFAAMAGGTFPKRAWSAELVWLFLTLRDKGFVDAEGNSNVD